MCVNHPTALVQRDWGETNVLDRRNPTLLLTDQDQNPSMRTHAWFEAFQTRYSELGDADPHAVARLEHAFLERVTSTGDVFGDISSICAGGGSISAPGWLDGCMVGCGFAEAVEYLASTTSSPSSLTAKQILV